MENYKNVNEIKMMCYKVLPLVYDDSLSYYEVLCKVTGALNQVIENTNLLPTALEAMVKEYVTTGAIDDVLREILATYMLNVKYPPHGIQPATGDGTANDTEAVQACLDYARDNGGGVVYLPYGKYLVNSLTMYDNVGIMGFDRYSTELVLAGGAESALLTGVASNCNVCNLTINANSGNQVNQVDCVHFTGTNYLFSNLILKNGYNLVTINARDGNAQFTNIIALDCTHRAFNIYDNITVQMNSVSFVKLSETSGDCLIYTESNNGVYSFVNKSTAPVAVKVRGSNNYFTGNVGDAKKPYEDTGESNTFIFANKIRSEKFNDSFEVVKNKTVNILEAAIVDAVTATMEIEHLIVNVGDMDENISGTKTVGCTALTEKVTTKTLEADTVHETLTGDKNVTVANAIEKVQGDKTIQASDFTVTADNYTVTVGQDLLESVKGGTTREAHRITERAHEKVIDIESITVTSESPVQIGTPQQGNYFDYLNGMSLDGSPYKFLLENENTGKLSDSGTMAHILDGQRRYIDQVNGDDKNDGTQESPWKSLTPFFNEANDTKNGRVDIRAYIVSAGTYSIPPQSYNNITLHLSGLVDGVILEFSTTRDVKFYECHTNFKNLTIKAPNATEFAFDGGSVSLHNCTFPQALTAYACQGYLYKCNIHNLIAQTSTFLIDACNLTNTNPTVNGWEFRSCMVRFQGSSQNADLTDNGTTNSFLVAIGCYLMYGITFRNTENKYYYGLTTDGSYIVTNATHYNNFTNRSVAGINATGFGSTIVTKTGLNLLENVTTIENEE